MMSVPFTKADVCWCQPFVEAVNPNCPMHGINLDPDAMKDIGVAAKEMYRAPDASATYRDGKIDELTGELISVKSERDQLRLLLQAYIQKETEHADFMKLKAEIEELKSCLRELHDISGESNIPLTSVKNVRKMGKFVQARERAGEILAREDEEDIGYIQDVRAGVRR
jgi:5'-deoxynucleotidase YfbR-like HD superfamily hydrolase